MSLLDAPYRYTTLQKTLMGIAGLVLFLLLWWFLAEQLAVQQPIGSFNTRPPSSLSTDPAEIAFRDSILRADSIAYANATDFKKVYPLLPPPHKVFSAFPELISPGEESVNKSLINHAAVSVWRNLQGYFWAVFFSLLIGIPIAISPIAKAMFSRQIDTLRFVPLTALTPIFLIIFRPEASEAMKVSFLAFGILVYLLPVVMQRLWETEDVYLKTAYTLGASDWQLVKSVYIPAVLSKLIDDIRVLTAISWTYIIIAEVYYRTDGLGSLSYILGRQGNVAGVFAVLISIVIIGYFQDQLFAYMNRRLFPHRDVKSVSPGLKETRNGFLIILSVVMFYLLLKVVIGTVPIVGFIVAIVVAAAALLIIFGEFKLRTAKTAS
ncbi:ABC transporter permease [Neolewinella agarilytica]|uniref:ABC-type nitrate/sulfonate/bicarbonate transport system, permease component n=1 Tax=Neolewinella agarilytica TaxID=478744 RepID=A0A1H9J5C0_9BACT|nr:ABC transporter permease subunit [Neolewinella agarilytica]SEQ82074.1 ABC-type nitrate/sulfonate/bicarbonate transport system, permease component [Neolewinella agarilytica]